MSEVIRDVQIRVSVVHAETRAFETSRRQAGEMASAVEKVSETVRKQNGELDAAAREWAGVGAGAVRAHGEIDNAIDKPLRKEREMLAAIRGRIDALDAANGVAGAPVVGGIGGAPPRGPSGGGGGPQGLEAASFALSRAAIPVAVIAFSAEAAQGFASGFKSLAIQLTGTQAEKEQGGLVTPFFKGIGEDVGEGLLRFGASDNPIMSLLGRAGLAVGMDVTGMDVGTAGKAANFAAGAFGMTQNVQAALEQEQRRFAAVEREVALREQQVTLVEQVHAKERSGLQEQLRLNEDRLRMQQQIMEQEQAKLDAAAGQFGMLDPLEQRTFREAAGKIKDGGLGSLSKEELGLIRGNQAFSGLFNDEAMKSADAAGFKDLIRELGLDSKKNAAEEQVALNVQQRMEITADISNIDAAVNKFRDALAQSQQKLVEEMLQKVQLQIAIAAQQAKPPATF